MEVKNALLKEMDAIILAAGEGRRFQAISPLTPKCIYPLNAQSDCLLGRLLQQLIYLEIRHIYIVGGYQIEQLNSWLEESGISRQKYTLIDARDDYKRGPLHSLMAFSQEILKKGELTGQYLVCPADTWYSPSFITEIQNILTKPSIQSCNLLFYGKAEPFSPLGSMVLEIDSKSPTVIKKIFKIQSNTEDYSRSHEIPEELSFLLPMMILSTDFFHQAQKMDLSNYQKIIAVIQTHLGKQFEFWAYELLITTPFYLDMDTEQDLTKIQKLI